MTSPENIDFIYIDEPVDYETWVCMFEQCRCEFGGFV